MPADIPIEPPRQRKRVSSSWIRLDSNFRQNGGSFFIQFFHRRLSSARARSFTLIEAIVVIVIAGILSTIVAMFIRTPVQGYMDTVARAQLVDAGDLALRRIARDVQAALPNSLRGVTDGSPKCFEFLPTVGGGRYRAAPASNGTGDILDFSVADISFDVLASTGLPPPGGYNAATYNVVIYNLGIPGADAYNTANHVRAAIDSASSASPITLAAANKFPFESPANRFQVIPNFSVVYSCSGNQLLRSTQAIAAATLAACPGQGGTVLAGNVDCGNSSFVYLPAASQRNGLLTMTLALTQPGSNRPMQNDLNSWLE